MSNIDGLTDHAYTNLVSQRDKLQNWLGDAVKLIAKGSQMHDNEAAMFLDAFRLDFPNTDLSTWEEDDYDWDCEADSYGH